MKKTALSVVVTMLATAGGTAQANESLNVSAYGGSWGDALQACIFTPFEEATGIDVVVEPSASSVTLSKLQAEASSPIMDVAWMDGGVSELARDSGVVAPIDPSLAPGLAGVIDQAKYKTEGGGIYAVGNGYFAVGIVYNSEEITTPPTSWEDLWNAEYAGRVILPSAVNSIGVPIFAAFNALAGGTLDDLTPGIEKMKTLEPALFFDSSGVANSGFQTGEGVIGAHYATQAFTMADGGLPIAYAIPKEGAMASDIRIHIVKGTKNSEAAHKLVDFAVQPAQAGCLATRLQVGPSTSGVELPPEVAARMPWGADGSIDDLAVADWTAINAYRDALSEAWTRLASGN
ncbi:putative spermidine/putrescine transport system substrate-binding protein [Roseovarius litoreus]|uniref:Putative spermidine/putrescine transport system substrate-binding protein n=1 Tax=Roseovarius litoreus TaxID=1155722 RepID=A0A1M7LNT7_9RHOB|nr:ABC transporter substrate-binding protein [Roseovarius litoreus]SHM79308.1 putative spermidine/putrescine transport system substrate-binding protein [Roseovarius litoreus]